VRKIFLAGAAWALATAAIAPAHEGLIGAQVTYEGLYPDASTADVTIGAQTITSGTSIFDSGSVITTTFTDDEIIITNDSPGLFGAASFNGPSYTFSGITLNAVATDPPVRPTCWAWSVSRRTTCWSIWLV
jgi:hypothetical protein